MSLPPNLRGPGVTKPFRQPPPATNPTGPTKSKKLIRELPGNWPMRRIHLRTILTRASRG
jgi:hypothetical protein